MKQILEQYCLDDTANGLLLLSMPTGFGKTHDVLNFIYENYQRFADQKRKIIFVTNLKKNLPYEELRERFLDDDMKDTYDKHVLFIDSNSKSVMNNLPYLDSEIPDQFKNTETYSRLMAHIKVLENNRNFDKTIVNSFKNEIQRNLEPAFRRIVIEQLYREFDSKKNRIEAIKKDPDYQWIGKLYPAVFAEERTIIFLSMDKFILKNTPLIEKSYYFYNKFIKNSLVFIDEFDATKERVLNHIIESGVRHRVNLLDLFLNIHHHLMQSEFPEGLLKESEHRKMQKTERNWLPFDVMANIFKQKAEKIFNKYNLHNTCKSHELLSTTKRNFLFYDYQFHHVLDTKNKRIEIVTDPDSRTNWINTVEHGEKGDGTNIHGLLSEIAGFLTFFQKRVSNMADNYCYLKQEDDLFKEDFPLESAVRTVLNHFRLDRDDVDFLTNNIMEGEIPYGRRSRTNSLQKSGFYDSGFRYHDIVDSDEHDTQSKIYMYNFTRTPESFLVSICSQAMVVGISATAGLHTNIGNYDLDYLNTCLGNRFIRLSGKELNRLKRQFIERTQGYDNVSIKTSFVETGDSLTKLEELLKDREAAVSLKTRVMRLNSDVSDQKIDYILSRYTRILMVWKYFLDNSDINSFLCFFNKFPRHEDPELDLDLICKYAEMIVKSSNFTISESVTEILHVLTGTDFEINKNELLSNLGAGKKRFIISSYQTLGAGQNMQYPIPKSFQPVHINDFSQRKEMDIGAIYLDKPTNLIVNIYADSIKDEDFIKYIFQLEFLVENGSISPKEFESKLDEAFHRYIGRQKQRTRSEDFTSTYQTEAYTRSLNKVIIQAVGRICRTNMKSPVIHILADSSIRKMLSSFHLPEDVIPVREYKALKQFAGEESIVPEETVYYENRASSRSERNAAFIQHQLRTPWTEESIKTWQNLREQVLKHPTIAEKGNCDPKWNAIYIELPSSRNRYKYTQKWDYSDIDVFFTENNGLQEVSERAARLSELMSIKPLLQLFTEKGWATCFEKGELMITPPIFNNIYKGALGEVCGKFILQEFIGIELQELEASEFERFDFKTSNNIYFDFKFWDDTYAVPADEVISKIRAKMEKCNAEKVFVVNILGNSDTSFKPVISDNKIIEIPFICKDRFISSEALEFIRKEFYK
jgi:hypothetical protein